MSTSHDSPGCCPGGSRQGRRPRGDGDQGLWTGRTPSSAMTVQLRGTSFCTGAPSPRMSHLTIARHQAVFLKILRPSSRYFKGILIFLQIYSIFCPFLISVYIPQLSGGQYSDTTASNQNAMGSPDGWHVTWEDTLPMQMPLGQWGKQCLRSRDTGRALAAVPRAAGPEFPAAKRPGSTALSTEVRAWVSGLARLQF